MAKEKLLVFVLEDEAAHAEAIIRGLQASCFDCEMVVSGSLSEFLIAQQTIVPQLVIADLNLPDGQAFDILTGDLETQDWPVLVTTSHGDEEMAVRAIKSGALDYIVKSEALFRELPRIVERAMREWQHIQKRRQAEASMRESESRYRTLFETMAQGVVYHDQSGQIISANHAAEEILGLTRDQLCNRDSDHPSWHLIREDGSLFSGAEHPAIVALGTGEPVRNVVMGVNRSSDGMRRWILVSAIPQFCEGETHPFQVYASFTDITENKIAAEILARQNEELTIAKEKAEESDRLKTAFLANVSHEIRTPMNGILGFAELLKVPDLTGEQQQKYIEVIEQSGQRMLTIINDIVDISRIEAGQVDVKFTDFSLSSVLSELYQFFRPEAERKNIELSFNNTNTAQDTIRSDATKLSQVLSNLIKNALKFTASGKVCYTVQVIGHELHFSVADTGIGIQPELRERVFERFFQAEFSNSRKYEGVGLGLAISKAYVELLGGRIWLDSEWTKGSTFYFTIPLPIVPSVARDIVPENTTWLNLPELSIVVAEDDEVSFMYLEEVLQNFTTRLLHARDGREAVEFVKANKDVQVVLMDVKMPVMDGLEATRTIHSLRPDLPVIMQSAFVTDEDVRLAYQAGCSDYLKKPLLVSQLISSLNRLFPCT